MRYSTLTLLVAALLMPAAAQAQTTTRIETRPFYGATVTLEEGVRVFRPLPSHDRVIINPGGATPLNLTFEERRSVSHNHTQQANTGGDGYASSNGVYGGGYGHRGGVHQPRIGTRSVNGTAVQGVRGAHR